MNKKDILLTGLCITVLGGCAFKAIKIIKKHREWEVINNDEMAYQNGQ